MIPKREASLIGTSITAIVASAFSEYVYQGVCRSSSYRCGHQTKSIRTLDREDQ